MAFFINMWFHIVFQIISFQFSSRIVVEGTLNKYIHIYPNHIARHLVYIYCYTHIVLRYNSAPFIILYCYTSISSTFKLDPKQSTGLVDYGMSKISEPFCLSFKHVLNFFLLACSHNLCLCASCSAGDCLDRRRVPDAYNLAPEGRHRLG